MTEGCLPTSRDKRFHSASRAFRELIVTGAALTTYKLRDVNLLSASRGRRTEDGQPFGAGGSATGKESLSLIKTLTLTAVTAFLLLSCVAGVAGQDTQPTPASSPAAADPIIETGVTNPSPKAEGGGDLMPVVLSAAVTCIITMLCTWWIAKGSQSTEIQLLTSQLSQANKETKNSQDETKRQAVVLNEEKNALTVKLAAAEKEKADLKAKAQKLESIRKELRKGTLVRTYRQPVILVGPRFVGKTSLLMQWHAPWNTSRLDRTHTHYTSDVPVYDFTRKEDRTPHYADPDITVPFHTHLILKVHDFPGETEAQKSVCQMIVHETHNLHRESGKNLGLVLVCMFDAEEAATGISQDTKKYYNGELFRELRSLVAHNQVEIERLILVFNKYDQLKALQPGLDDRELLRLCVNKFDPTYDLLHNIVNPEKVCEVFTVLSREEMHLKNRGAPIVLGEAARSFVRAFAGREAETKVIEQSASTYAAEKFL